VRAGASRAREDAVLDLFRDAKSEDLDPAFVVDEDVATFDVAMDDLALV